MGGGEFHTMHRLLACFTAIGCGAGTGLDSSSSPPTPPPQHWRILVVLVSQGGGVEFLW